MTDNTQELDPIINIMDMWDFSPLQDEDIRRARVYKEIQAHTNAAIAKEIKLIRDALVGFTGDNDFVIVAIDRRIAELEAERAKLKEVK